MTVPSISLRSPTGRFGMGLKDVSLERGISINPNVIACDAGATDSGLFYLGDGMPKMSRSAILQNLRRLLLSRDHLKIPLIISSCRTSWLDSGVDWIKGMTLEVTHEEHLSLKLGRVCSEHNPEVMAQAFQSGKMEPLPEAPEIDEQIIQNCSHIVAIIGHEPIVHLLE